jgi:hypothetical protein
MSVVVIQKEKENFLKMFRQYLNYFNNTGILQGLKNNIYFVSKLNIKKRKRQKASRAVAIDQKKIKNKKILKLKISPKNKS